MRLHWLAAAGTIAVTAAIAPLAAQQKVNVGHLASPTVSVRLFTALALDDNLRYAREHAELISRFGRFPSRNAALGRVSTPAEDAYLAGIAAARGNSGAA